MKATFAEPRWLRSRRRHFVCLAGCPVLDSRTAGYDLLNGMVLGEDKRLAIDMAARQYKRMELRDWFVGCLAKSPEMAS